MSEGPDTAPAVLVVDDDRASRGLLEVWLRRLGYAPLVAASGVEAVNTFRAYPGPVALVLLDVHMPGGDGPATLAALRQLDPAVRCVFMTGVSVTGLQDLLALGAVGVLNKPFWWKDLADTLRRLIPPDGGEPGDRPAPKP